MSRINGFLKSLKETVRKSKSYGLVTGNQSGDLDSVVCAISYAYLSHQLDPSKTLLPFLNFRRAELNARKDIVFAFSNTGVDAEQLYYVDDLPQLIPSELILVDHNYPQGEVAKLALKVTEIIDHHEDEGKFLDAYPRIIEKSGSCSSLVANFWVSRGAVLDEEIVQLLIAPLVIDTRNLTSRVEQHDVYAAKSYTGHVPQSQFTSVFQSLQEAKEDITGLSVKEILAKDYKLFEFGVGSAEVLKNVGFSSIVKPFGWLFKEHPDFVAEMREYLSDRSLDILVIMTSFERDGQFRRELATIQKNDSDEMLMKLALERDLAEKLDLKPQQNSDYGLEVYDQLNVAASRKQVAPAIKQALERL